MQGLFTLASSMLDRQIRSIEISGPFQRVTALQIEEAISDELVDGFVSADLARIQEPYRGHAVDRFCNGRTAVA